MYSLFRFNNIVLFKKCHHSSNSSSWNWCGAYSALLHLRFFLLDVDAKIGFNKRGCGFLTVFNATNLQILQFFFHVTLLFYYFDTTKFPIALLTAGQQEEGREALMEC